MSWAIIDQSFYSLAHMFLNFTAARWVPINEFGLLSILWAIARYVRSLHEAIIIEPVLVFGVSDLKLQLKAYLSKLVRYFLILFFLALIFLVFGIVFNISSIYIVFLFTEVSVLLLIFLRKCGFVLYQIFYSALASGIYAFMLFFFLLMFSNEIKHNGVVLLVGVGFASLISNIVLLKRFGLFLSSESGIRTKKIIILHWKYGRWSSLASFFTWFPRNVYYIILPFFCSIEAAGNMRAFINFLLPISLTLSSLSSYLLVYFSRLERKNLIRIFVLSFCIILLLTSFLGLVIGMFHESLVRVVYGDRYKNISALLWIVSFIMVINGTSNVAQMLLKALKRPDLVFWAQVFASVSALIFSFILIPYKGLVGAFIAMFLSALTSGFSLNIFALRVLKKLNSS